MNADITNAEALRHLMHVYHLSRGDVALLLGRSPKTVESWLAGENSQYRRNMPDHALELLRLKTAARNGRRHHAPA